MICCKECIDLLYSYLEGELDGKVAGSLEEHFQDCPPCIAFLNTYKTTTRLCRETLNQEKIPDIVQVKLKEFIDTNIKKHK
ncbi:MAG: hypothetical protein A3K09_06245 [Nitrospinae bacterium RIFCSPLOWO2_12_FULL_47_7]|nr:MAG: hypothetical protein A3K09_06245 [Nitrospinae bacterium RIFCSPLOWO2_12_FULL_47_7]